jgi:uncharacterized repeat protein (TIGR03803 family)
MRQRKFWFVMTGILLVLAVVLMLPTGARAASKYKVLYGFKGGADGANPGAGLIFDTAGDLYGTTEPGGANGGGTAFDLTRNSDGSWTESVLYSFCALTKCADGTAPRAGLTLDTAGNLYGTTEFGGAQGYGTVFKLTPNSDGSWTESVLQSFGADGAYPGTGSLIFDAAGNLYGTSSGGGASGRGTVFKLTPNRSGSWTESVLYSFCARSNCADGAYPGGVVFDGAGNLYGTTLLGGTKCSRIGGCGTVFTLTPNSDGSWTESVLYSFHGVTGKIPSTGLVFDAAGNIYGTTSSGGGTKCFSGCGVVFKLKPNSDGSSTESVLYNLHGFTDGKYPSAGLVFDAAGNLYRTTAHGGRGARGVVFKLVPKSGGGWAYGVLHVFRGKPARNPSASLVLDNADNLFGTTAHCEQECAGVVFEVTP